MERNTDAGATQLRYGRNVIQPQDKLRLSLGALLDPVSSDDLQPLQLGTSARQRLTELPHGAGVLHLGLQPFQAIALDRIGGRGHQTLQRRDKQGRMLSRTWSKEEVLKAVPWLKRENAKGADIYIRPGGDDNQGLVLVDDLSVGQVERMKAAGFSPAVLVETSPQNHQAWVRLSESPLNPRVASFASKALAKRYDGDPNSADWRHFGRLAGFTNRKPQHVSEAGSCPWVLCHEAPGHVATSGQRLVIGAEEAIERMQVQREKAERLRTAYEASERPTGAFSHVQEYRRQLSGLHKRYGDDMDFSRADFMIGRDMVARGYSLDAVADAIYQASPGLAERKAGHEDDYVQRTLHAVWNDPSIVRIQQERERENDRGGLSL